MLSNTHGQEHNTNLNNRCIL